ncbi:MAG: hypothetical protein JEZ08_05180 [Clostridiales bacterium]|nr:hypothetical protein [Clostridiales bacterium]
MYYFIFYIPLTREVESLLGYPKVLELLMVFIFIFLLMLPFSYGVFLVVDYYKDIIYPKEWMTMTLLEKHKKYFSSINPRTVSGRSGYRYWFDFLDEEGNMYRFYGSTNEYECLIEGAKVQIHVKGPMIREIALIEDQNLKSYNATSK